jgi:4'-phosphopantetheinyl transferase
MTALETCLTPEIVWAPAPNDLQLTQDEVHVFCASLDLDASRLADLALTLSKDERERAERFRFRKDRIRFIASRGLLRELLGWLLRVDASRLAFSYAPHGKPSLAEPVSGRSLCFNLAHADSLAVYAVAWEREIGVDVERFRIIEGAESFAERYFSKREVSNLLSTPLHQRTEAFFNCWTRKEACLKASGHGIGESLSRIEVSLIPGQPARLLSLVGDSQAPDHWLLQSLAPAAAYVGAVAAARARHLHVRCWKWQAMGNEPLQ